MAHAYRMIARSKLHRFLHRTGIAVLAAVAILMLCSLTSTMHAASGPQPPWHIESFCHRGATPAHRCLVRARQGILVFQLAEISSAPTVSWSEGVAVLASGADERSRQLRFFAPPQKFSSAFRQVRAYDVQQQLVAVYTDGRVHLRRMFADGPDVAVLNLPADASVDTLRVRFEDHSLHASWRDRAGRAHEQSLPAKH